MKKWTMGKSLLLLFLLLDLTLVAGWLIVFFPYYKAVSTVVAGIWSAVIAVLSFLKIKARKTESLSSFIGLLPVRIIIKTYTILIFLGSVLFIFWEFDTHKVRIETLSLEEGTGVNMMLCSDEDTLKHRTNNGIWELYVKKGGYELTCHPEGYREKSTQVRVGLFSLRRQEVKISGFEKFSGYLRVVYSPPAINLSISNEQDEKVRERERITGGDQTFPMSPGRYRIKGESSGYFPDSSMADIYAQDTTEVEIRLSRSQGTLIVRTQPEGMKILLDHESTDRLTPSTLTLPPKNYTLELKMAKDDTYGYYLKKAISIIGLTTTTIDTALNAIELCALNICPEKNGIQYDLDNESISFLDQPCRTFRVLPGEHRLTKRVDGEVMTKIIRIDVDEKRKLVHF